MGVFEASILGIVQGVTEFLPISSTGHLIFARELLGLTGEFGLAVDAVLHFATALAVLIYFRKDFVHLAQQSIALVLRREVAKEDQFQIIALIAGTIPAVVLGLLLQDYIATVFRNPLFVAFGLIIGSLLFVIAEYVGKRIEIKQEITPKKGIIIGCFQALALVPGMSRSGSTISGGLLLGLSRERAARFAFLLSLPIILGAGMVKALELGTSGVLQDELLPVVVAFFAAFISGMLAIHFLLAFLRKYSLLPFAVYRIVVAAIVIMLYW